MQASKKLMVAAIAANRYVKLAVEAGYQVICLDAFADVDTQYLTPEWHQISVHDGQFDANSVLAVLDRLDLSDVLGVCYGAGFEPAPALLTDIARRLPVLGNQAECVNRCKDPMHFFEACKALSIPLPEVSLTPPDDIDGWLYKQVGGSGGIHVLPATSLSQPITNNGYYQRKLAGQVYSCLFMAYGSQVQCLGFNQQWLSPILTMPYRLGGVVSAVKLESNIEINLIKCIKKLSQYYDLKGLNSIDFVCEGDDFWVLEINPRLSASASLYDLKPGCLMNLHVALCQDKPWAEVMAGLNIDDGSKAFQVMYAEEAMRIPPSADWPDWVSDIPHAGLSVAIGAPVVTVNASAETPEAACDLLARRTAMMNEQLKTMVMK